MQKLSEKQLNLANTDSSINALDIPLQSTLTSYTGTSVGQALSNLSTMVENPTVLSSTQQKIFKLFSSNTANDSSFASIQATTTAKSNAAKINFLNETNNGTSIHFYTVSNNIEQPAALVLKNGGVSNLFLSNKNLNVDNYITEQHYSGIPDTQLNNFTLTYTDRRAILNTITSWYYYINGTKYDVNNTITFEQHTNTYGAYFFYFTDTYITSTTPWEILNSAQVLTVYYNSDNPDVVKALPANELHGIMIGDYEHKYKHLTEGTTYFSGGALGNLTTNSSVTTAVCFSVDTATIFDEDLTISTQSIPAGGPYFIMWRTLTSGVWNWTTTSTLPILIGSTPAIQYNGLISGTWTRAEVTNNSYVNYYVFFSNLNNKGTAIIPGQSQYTSIATAQAEGLSNVSFGTLPFQEFTGVWQVTFRRSGTVDSAGRSIIAATPVKINQSKGVITGAIGNHSSLSGRDTVNSHPISAISSAFGEGEILFSSGSSITSSTNLTYTNSSIFTINGGAGSLASIFGYRDYVQSSTSTGVSIVDTEIISQSGKSYELWVVGNPNNGGTTFYRNVYQGVISVVGGYDGVVKYFIYYTQLIAHSALPGNILTVTPKLLFSNTEYDSTVTAATIRINISGYNTDWPGAGQIVRMKEIL